VASRRTFNKVSRDELLYIAIRFILLFISTWRRSDGHAFFFSFFEMQERVGTCIPAFTVRSVMAGCATGWRGTRSGVGERWGGVECDT
jgi:hypothetical protein